MSDQEKRICTVDDLMAAMEHLHPDCEINFAVTADSNLEAVSIYIDEGGKAWIDLEEKE